MENCHLRQARINKKKYKYKLKLKLNARWEMVLKSQNRDPQKILLLWYLFILHSAFHSALSFLSLTLTRTKNTQSHTHTMKRTHTLTHIQWHTSTQWHTNTLEIKHGAQMPTPDTLSCNLTGRVVGQWFSSLPRDCEVVGSLPSHGINTKHWMKTKMQDSKLTFSFYLLSTQQPVQVLKARVPRADSVLVLQRQVVKARPYEDVNKFSYLLHCYSFDDLSLQ